MKKQGRKVDLSDLDLKKNVCIVVDQGKIKWVGKQDKISKELKKQIKQTIDVKGNTVLPGFIDCHTHMVFAGSRQHEFELRNQGVSYQEINKQGGGIGSTVRATRKASLDHLTNLAQDRVKKHLSQGVTTVEVKSGYGLSLKDEIKMLKAIKNIKKVNTVSTFLGPHSLPKEFNDHQTYIDYVIDKILPAVSKAQLADRVDIFIEKGFFTPTQADQYFKAAKSFNLGCIAHTEQLSLQNGYKTALKYDAVSLDHVIELDKAGIKTVAKSKSTAILLPIADFYLKTNYPNARALIDQGGRVAIATDYNPGSAPSQDLSLLGVLSRLEMKMKLHEVISGLTVGAAFALNKQNQIGCIDIGYQADFCVIDGDVGDLFYQIGHHPVLSTYVRGVRHFGKL
ncbi:MAG: imidazolonepropionase [Bdellovibrionales bacterium]|nr:imidazolonepropionase [Bdellovibrionales bacterium]